MMLKFIMYGSDVNFIGYLMLMFMLILMLKIFRCAFDNVLKVSVIINLT